MDLHLLTSCLLLCLFLLPVESPWHDLSPRADRGIGAELSKTPDLISQTQICPPRLWSNNTRVDSDKKHNREKNRKLRTSIMIFAPFLSENCSWAIASSMLMPRIYERQTSGNICRQTSVDRHQETSGDNRRQHSCDSCRHMS